MDSILLVDESNSFSTMFIYMVAETLNVNIVVADSYAQTVELINSAQEVFSTAVVMHSLHDAANGEAVDFVISQGIPCFVLLDANKKDLRDQLLNTGVLDCFFKDSHRVVNSIIRAVGKYLRNKLMHILVIDDSKSIRVHLEQLLSRHGYVVFLAEDGREALKVIAGQKIHLAISDYQMPNMDGLQFVKKLRTKFLPDELGVIGLSSFENSDLAVQFMKFGANDFLVKPFKPEELLCRVSQNIELIERRKELGSLIERHRSILTHALDAIITTDDTGRVLDYNPAAELLFGHKKESVLGQNIDQLIVPAEYIEQHKKALKHRSTLSHDLPSIKRRIELPGVRSDGKIVDLQISLTSNIADHKINYTAFIQDITDKKQLLTSLQETLNVAESANLAKDEFLANMSHEIRTPMNAVLGFTELALKAELPKRVQDYLEKIENASRSLMGVINDILDFSKVDTGHMQLDPVKFDLQQLFDHLADLFSKQIADKHIELVFLVPDAFDKVLFGDVLRLEQILINLIRNAIKFTSKGSIIVQCTPELADDNHYNLKYSVTDDGIGIEEEVLPNLFDPFVQADGSTTRKYGGTGLGLSICKKLVTLMGGNIGVTSTLGEGSEVFFNVLVSLVSENKRAKDSIPKELWNKKTLLVDDHPQCQKQISGLLESVNLIPTLSSSGKEALTELVNGIKADAPYELLFIDWDMPGKDGITSIVEISATIKAAFPEAQLPTIFLLTPFGIEYIKTESEKLGIPNFIDKPVTRARLIRGILQAYEEKPNSVKIREHIILGHEVDTGEKICGGRILLVEDNDINQQVALGLLHRVGLIVDIANNGQEALSMIKQLRYDAILMDIDMPVLDGLATTRQIRLDEQFKDIGIVAMTTNSEADEIKLCFDAGMDSFLNKPIRPERLYGVLAKLINKVDINVSPDFLTKESNSDDLPNIVGIDIQDGLSRAAGNKRLYRRILSRFLKEHKYTTEKVRQAMNGGNLSDVGYLLHGIKGFAVHIGAISLFEAIEVFEEEIKQGSKEGRLAAMRTFSNRLNSIIDGLGGIKEIEFVPAVDKHIMRNVHIEFDREIIAPLVKELGSHLKYNSLGFEKSLEKIKAILEPTPTNILLLEMEKHIKDYHFHEAFDVLSKIIILLDIDVSIDTQPNLEKNQDSVLIVDDQRSNIDLLKNILTEFNLFVALDGRKALEVAGFSVPIDLILLDIMMPEMNGYEVCRQLKNNQYTKEISVIFVTAKKETSDESEGFAVGGVDYITKPFSSEIIKHRVASCLELKRYRNQLEQMVESKTIELAAATKKAEERKEAAESGNRAKSDFLSRMSHEIRTPLNAILGMGELVLETDLDEEQCKYIQVSQRAGQSLHALVNDILDLSKIEAGQMLLEISKFDIISVLNDVYHIQKINSENKGIKLLLDIDQKSSINLEGDPNRIKQILLNLVNNAIKFTEEGEVTISFEQREEHMFCFIVSDTGIGMQAEHIERIFQPFIQCDSSTTRKFGGTGLGLAICHHLVAAMNGKLEVFSEPGKGSTFIVTLPLVPADEPLIELSNQPFHYKTAKSEQDSKTDPGMKIMIVDDTEENIIVLEGYLKNSPHKFLSLGNGQEAFEAYKNGDFDLILMDMLMPVMDGYEATRAIRDLEQKMNRPQTPIIAITAQALKEDKARTLEAGCSYHLTKPIRKKVLFEIIDKFSNQIKN
ncbi:MAG: response regulator [Magnetococcales bacterium]|nr:response regulator [Magnetococcales bacterium]